MAPVSFAASGRVQSPSKFAETARFETVIEEEGAPKAVFDSPKSEKLKNFLSSIGDKDGE